MPQPDRSDASEPSETLWQAAKGDVRGASGTGTAAVVAMVAWIGFQWGWGNDILLPPIVANAFEAIDDGESWTSGASAVAAGTAAGSLFWGATQTLDAIIVLSGFRLLPRITARISAFTTARGLVKPFGDLSLGTKFMLAYVSGASVLCLIDVFATGRPGLQSRRNVIIETVALAVAGVALTITVVTAATAVGARVPSTEGAARTILRYAKNPLTWLAIYGAGFGISSIVSRLRSSPTDSKPTDP